MLHWSILLAGVAFTAIASTQASIIGKWENPDLDQGIAEQDLKNLKFAGGYSPEFGVGPGQVQTCNCGYVNGGIRVAGRIINGTVVQQESKYPFIVSLLDARTGRHGCGGSIITPLHILTAAHCYSDRYMKNQPDVHKLIPIVGLHRQHQGGSHGQTQELRVARVFIQDDWYAFGGGAIHGDLAVLLLETPIIFSQWVGPVCLTPVMPPIANTAIKVMGWGLTENGVPETLRETDLIAKGQHCPLDPSTVCYAAYVTSTCRGDSGGPHVYLDPVTYRYIQVSLDSAATPTCNEEVYGTSVVHYYNYIQQVVAETSGGYGICQLINQAMYKPLHSASVV